MQRWTMPQVNSEYDAQPAIYREEAVGGEQMEETNLCRAFSSESILLREFSVSQFRHSRSGLWDPL